MANELGGFLRLDDSYEEIEEKTCFNVQMGEMELELIIMST